ncbi:hypothetical protein Ccar_22730 [Clostridium carboxidivorans P7]|uniref:Uncharacterized protein n=1 Tax=Clostridium carboxidivorans P7 TaxID=536227 RepID=C6PWH7_9CLOT|nr:DUF6762 family protein [Clostridium carboxidivorans]AKN33489.1 hypothetical protein Ccar_22730 [Clostridium carboxidivorans P7]EET86388.1 conserved hypothetical protein [Clostridium carboxidivorans P7]EFG89130.1 hypothetical protein CLCAR_1003 [Clostridium carboxidivorans P7]
MNFSSLVLMEKDKETNLIVKELGSYEVSDGAEYITKMFYDGDKVNVYFDTNSDVEEWQYSAIFDLFDVEAFSKSEYVIEDVDDEYNPTWLVKFDYVENHEDMNERINNLCVLIKDSMVKVFDDIEGKKEEYE